jgi:pilus assembly protein CpaE
MTVVNLIEEAEDLDVEHFDNIVQTHESGMKVLLGPERPEFADEVRVKPGAYAEILRKVSSTYDFIVVDTASTLDEVSLALFDVATKIVLVGVPTLPCVKNLKFALDLFDKLEYPPDKTMLVLNKVVDPPGKNGTLSLDRIQSYLKRPVLATIPVVDEGIILNAIMKAVPVIASDRNTNKAPIRQLLDLADTIYKTLFVKTEEDKEKSDKEKDKKKSGLSLRLGR